MWEWVQSVVEIVLAMGLAVLVSVGVYSLTIEALMEMKVSDVLDDDWRKMYWNKHTKKGLACFVLALPVLVALWWVASL